MDLKTYKREGIVSAWSNSKVHSELLVCSAPMSHDDTLHDLEIMSVDLADRSKNLTSIGKAYYDTPFRCLAWDTFGEKDDTYPHGLIFGGMEDGSFTLWNPSEMIGKNPSPVRESCQEQPSLLYVEESELESDGSPILCAEWNSLKNNYLAFGSTSLLLLNVGEDASSPEILKPSEKNPHSGSYVTSVTWNKEVAHILASAGSDGLIALWDIKNKKSIFNFKDSSSNTSFRQVEIAWSKHISTQIAVTLDDDRKNELQIWDLRNKKGPIIVIEREHTKGINSMDWSELDHDLILTASRDQKVVCWNYKEDESPVSKREVESDIVKVSWSRTLPSIYSLITADGLSVCSLDEKNILSYVPKWMKVPVSSTFNGNDNLLVYSQNRNNTLNEYTITPKVKASIASEISVLEEFLSAGAVAPHKLPQSDSTFWSLIAAKRHGDGDSAIYDYMGLSKEQIVSEVEKYTGKKRDSTNLADRKQKTKAKSAKVDYIPFSATDAANFFGSLDSEGEEPKAANEDEPESESIKYDMVPRNSNWNIGKERLIKENMLIGNYEGAIDAALKCGRTAEALIIAYSIDQNTFNNTLKTFCTETTDHFISDILRHIAFKDNEELVRKYDVQQWKECVALIYSLSTGEKRKSLLSLLGSRIAEEYEAFEEAGVCCYALAERFNEVVEIYSKRLKKLKTNSVERKALLVNLGTKLLGLYASLTINVKPTVQFEKIVREMGMVCLEAGKKLTAYDLFIKYAPNSTSRYIDYLIHNTPELADYRAAPPIVQLPVMAAKKTDKANKLQQGKGSSNVPTNMKPVRGGPPRPVPISEPQETKPLVKPPKRGVPPPPSYENEEPKHVKHNPPPPPPPMKKGPSGPTPVAAEPQYSTSTITPPPKRGPPPPPKPATKTQSQQDDQPTGLPPSRKNHPPPPPPPSHHVEPTKIPSNAPMSHPSIPGRLHKPPPKQEEAVQNQYDNSPQQTPKPSRVPPPPPASRQLNPPPVSRQPPPVVTKPTPPSDNRQPPPTQDHRQPPHPTQDHRQPPPPRQTPPPPGGRQAPSYGRQPPPPQEQQYGSECEEEEEYEEEYPPQQKKPYQQHQVPPPQAPKKVAPPTRSPPPPNPANLNRGGSERHEEPSYQYQQEKRQTPKPAGRRAPPPPPIRR